MTKDTDELVSQRAYEIWEAEGRPHGRHHEHWQQAEHEVGGSASEPTEAKTPPAAHPGMMGDGTEEQNLDQPGTPGARITEEDVQAAFADKAAE